MWLYSSAEGYVYRSDMFVSRNVVAKFCEGAKHDEELIAVIKKP
jgi:LMBR1 domain-containing protein 1